MGMFSFLRRLGRVLELAEQVLGEASGVGPAAESFERHVAFRWDAGTGPGRLVAIESPAHFDLGDLIGVDAAVARLAANVEQFVLGLPSNNVLLHGERGTGKSSAVRGVLQRFAGRGLRLIEVQRQDLVQLPRVLAALRKDLVRHRFVIFCDDLSFGAGEVGFRELKAALEGSLEAPPENVLVVATSNRRHMLPESMAENRDAGLDESGELHLGEALEEKLALSDRFGLLIGFHNFQQPVYLEIVEHYLGKQGLELTAEAREEALRWTVDRASRSGRSAKQFVDDYVGRARLKTTAR
ncbi:MAG: ATP-binding protein [Myxococcota bacterium]|nr:ATP-binding protein [Myxococcota bacterium]